MRKLSIKNIIEFKSKSDKSKKSFALNLKIEKKKITSEGGGDYWISCLSAISNAYKNNDNKFILEKINELLAKYEETTYKITKDMYERNISILNNFKDIDFSKWIPEEKVSFLKKNKSDSIIYIKGLQIKAIPQHVFTFKNDETEIGAIWFIAKLDGYAKVDIAMFTDILYRYLDVNFSKEYNVNKDYCIVVDVGNIIDLSYSQVLKEKMPLKLDSTIDEIVSLM